MQLDFSPKTFRSHYPDRQVVQLAIDGSMPFAALHDIAHNTQFAGIVLCDVHAFCVADTNGGDPQQQYVDYHAHNWGFNRRWNRGILSAVQEQLALMNPEVGLNGLVKSVLSRRPRPPFTCTRADRQTLLDKTVVTEAVLQNNATIWAEKVRRMRQQIDSDGREAWERLIPPILADITAIHERGGRVVLIRFPTDGPVRVAETNCFPRAKFWDPFTRGTGGLALNYADSTVLSSFRCPEGSHIDYRDSPVFTQALCQELQALGVLAGTVQPSNVKEASALSGN